MCAREGQRSLDLACNRHLGDQSGTATDHGPATAGV